MTLAELIAALNAYANKSELVDGIKKDAKSVFQPIFDDGHGVAQARLTPKVTELETAVAAAKAETAAAQAKLTDYERDKPDLKALREGYEKSISELKTQLTDQGKAHAQVVTDMKLVNDRAALRTALADLKVDPDYAEVLIQRQDVASRIRYAQDGAREVLQLGREIPLAVAAGEDPIKELAKQLFVTVDKKWVGATTQAGTGTKNGGNATGQGTASVFDKVRADVKARLDAQPVEGDRLAGLQTAMGRAPSTGATKAR